MIKICEQCKENFNAKRSVKRFCGDDCAKQFRKDNAKKPVSLVCRNCDEAFVTKDESQIFCSKSCSAQFNNSLSPKRVKQGKCKRCQSPARSNRVYCSDECYQLDRPRKDPNLPKKHCPDCKEEKPKDLFHNSSSNYDGKQRICIDCNVKKVEKWQAENQDKYYEYVYARLADEDVQLNKRAQKYGLTAKELCDMLERAKGACDNCGRVPKKSLHVDHCHKTGKVRGLLCNKCNTGIGLFNDDPDLLIAAAEYLIKSRAE